MWWLLGCAALNPATNPLIGAERVALGGVGRVEEVLPAGGYTYLRVGEPERWLVVLGEGVAPGREVAWTAYARVHDFPSRRTGRRFDELWFATTKEQE